MISPQRLKTLKSSNSLPCPKGQLKMKKISKKKRNKGRRSKKREKR
jgi:hypothetical protein